MIFATAVPVFFAKSYNIFSTKQLKISFVSESRPWLSVNRNFLNETIFLSLKILMKITLGVRKYLKIPRLRRSLSLRTLSRLSLKNLVFSPFAKDFLQIVGFAKLWRTPPHPPGGFGTK